MTIGAESLLNNFGSRLAVAEALILGKIGSHQEEFASQLVDKVILEAARIRLEMKRKRNKKR